jgi:hypothetical protein
MAITAPILEGIMTATKLDQALYYAQSVSQMIASVENTYNQVQNMIRMEKMALDNLRHITEVKSFDDFMSWYNRQLYLERQAEQKFMNMGVKVGGQTIRMKEIDEIPGALRTSFVDPWKEGLSPEQRKSVWLNFGLTPANYMYVKAWEAREKELAINILTKRQIKNDEYQKAMTRNNEIAKQLNDDKHKSDEQKLGEKALLELLLEVMMDTNKATHDMHYDQLEAAERELARDKIGDAPPGKPDLSEAWNYELFGSITEEEGYFID